MKEQILETLCKHGDHPDVSGRRKINVDKTVDDLVHLMCYREVKARYDWVGPEYFQTDHEDGLVQQLENTYHTDLIWAAIDKCKAGIL